MIKKFFKTLFGIFFGLFAILGIMAAIMSVLDPKGQEINIAPYIILLISGFVSYKLLSGKSRRKMPKEIKEAKKAETSIDDILISERAQEIWEGSKVKYEIKSKIRDSGSLPNVSQDTIKGTETIDSIRMNGYEDFIRISDGLVLIKDSSEMINFFLFDLSDNKLVDLTAISLIYDEECTEKIVLLSKLYSYAMSNDLSIDKNEKAGIITLINGLKYTKDEVSKSKLFAMDMAIRETLSDYSVEKDEQLLLEAFRYSLNIKEKDNILWKQSAIMAKIGNLHQDDDLTLDKIKGIRDSAEELGCFNEEIKKEIEDLKLVYLAEQCFKDNLPTIDVPINLKKGEKAYKELVVEVEQQKTQKKTLRGYAGTRVKIGKIPIYLGGSAPKTIEKEVIKKIGDAELFLTNNRVILSGTKTNYSIPLAKILRVLIYRDCIQINYEGRYGGRFYTINDPNEIRQIAVLIHALIKRMNL